MPLLKRAQKKGAREGPESGWFMDLLIGSVVGGVRRQDDKAAVDRERLQLDAKSDTLFVGEGGADFGPAFLSFAVSFVFLDGEDVEVGEIATGCSNGRIASGRRIGVAPLIRRAGRVHGCTNGPAVGG